MSKLAIDLGGSKVRCMTKPGASCYGLSPEVKEPFTSTLAHFSEARLSEFIINKAPISKLKDRLFVVEKAIYAYKGKVLACDNQSFKAEQEVSIINMIRAVANHLVKCPDDSLEGLGICMPVREIYNQEIYSKFINQLYGDYEVTYPRANRTVNFTLTESNLKVGAEGTMAFIDYAKSKNLLQKFAKKITLIVDVGYRSTEIFLLKGMIPLFYSASSAAIGGITLEAYLEQILASAGILKSDIPTILNTGEVKQHGSQGTRVLAQINQAKILLASDLRLPIISVISSTTEIQNIQMIDTVFFSGRPLTKLGSEPNLAEHILEAIGSKAEAIYPNNLELANVRGMLGMMS